MRYSVRRVVEILVILCILCQGCTDQDSSNTPEDGEVDAPNKKNGKNKNPADGGNGGKQNSEAQDGETDDPDQMNDDGSDSGQDTQDGSSQTGGSTDSSGNHGGGSKPDSGVSCDRVTDYLILDEAHNYTFSSSVHIQSYRLADYPTVPTIDWSGVEKNILGHKINPKKDIGYVALSVWNLKDPQTFMKWVNTDSLEMAALQNAVSIIMDDLPKRITEAKLSEFTSFGLDVDPEIYFDIEGDYLDPDTNIVVLIVGGGSALGQDAIMVAFIEPDNSEDAPQTLKLTEDAVELTYQAKIRDAERYKVPLHRADITVDWESMDDKKNASGQPWRNNQANRVLLSYYSNKAIKDLEEEFLDLEIMADEMYTLDVEYADPITLGELQTEAGNPFEGFISQTGIWVLALQCTHNCNNPAPKYLTILQPCEATEEK